MDNTEVFSHSEMHPVSMILLILFSLIILGGKRKSIPVIFFLAISLIPITQAKIILGLDFNVIRILTLVALLRFIIKDELKRFNQIDYLVCLFTVLKVLIFSINVQSFSGFVFQVGIAYNIIGSYLVFRNTIDDLDELIPLFKKIAWISVIILPFFTYEKITGINPFSYIGGVRHLTYIRGGKLRVQGAYSHPIIAGTFWALLLPIAGGYFSYDKKRAIISLLTIFILIFFTASSTPMMVATFYFFGILMYKLKDKRKYFFLIVIIIYLLLSIFMSSPPYYLIAKIDLTGSSTGYYRFNLIKKSIEHFKDWAILGMGFISTETWGVGLWDVTNEYIAIAITGGLITLMSFLSIIVVTLKSISNLLVFYNDYKSSFLIWNLGVMMMMHVLAFLVISYFAQLTIMFYFTVAIVSTLTEQLNERKVQMHRNGSDEWKLKKSI